MPLSTQSQVQQDDSNEDYETLAQHLRNFIDEDDEVHSTDSQEVSVIEVREITNALNELITRRSGHHFSRYLGIINSYLEVEFNVIDNNSLDSSEVYEKSKEAFWYAFHFYIGQDALDTFFNDNIKHFEENGVFYELAWAHSYANYLRKTRATHRPFYQ